MTFRWFGAEDPVKLEYIRQIPGVSGIVSSLHDIPAGDAWPLDEIHALKSRVEESGLSLEVIESVPVHEDIKLGRPSRDRYIDNYSTTLENLSRADIPVVCYNFMPVFDWMRSRLDYPLSDGSTAVAYEEGQVSLMDPLLEDLKLPGWDASYGSDEVKASIREYQGMNEEALWENLEYFLRRVVETADEVGVKLAIHPDDPPWPIFGLPRIITDGAALERVARLVDVPANGVTLCTGSLGPLPVNDLPAIARRLGGMGRIHFAHCRNVQVTGDRRFHESPHPTGSVDMREVLRALHETGFTGPMRPDHGRMIWGEAGRPGYGLYDRALGAMYLQGLWEGLGGERSA